MPVLNYEQASSGEDDPLYGATVGDVKAFLPHRRWTPDSRPNEADILVYLDSVAGTLGVLVRPLPTDVSMANRLLALCHRAVVIGAAAHAEAAAAPERANPNDVSTYAEWLWRCYMAALEEARAFADALAPGDQPAGTDPQPLDPAWSFPPPIGWAARGI